MARSIQSSIVNSSKKFVMFTAVENVFYKNPTTGSFVVLTWLKLKTQLTQQMLMIDKKKSWQRMYIHAEVKIIKFHDKNMFWTMCYKPNFMTAKFKRSKSLSNIVATAGSTICHGLIWEFIWNVRSEKLLSAFIVWASVGFCCSWKSQPMMTSSPHVSLLTIAEHYLDYWSRKKVGFKKNKICAI
jgi:hypothetical protein